MSTSKNKVLEKAPTTPAPLTTTPSNAAKPSGYADFLLEVKTQIRQRQLQALRAVNSEMLALYWWLGEYISQRQAALGWGKAVVENLARDLQTEFPGRNGFSAQNLWLMRQFVNEYTAKPKLQPLVGEISWSKTCSSWRAAKTTWSASFSHPARHPAPAPDLWPGALAGGASRLYSKPASW